MTMIKNLENKVRTKKSIENEVRMKKNLKRI